MIIKPEGYRGIRHETIGRSILTVADSVMAQESILGFDLHRRLANVEREVWYPIELLLELLETIADRVGEGVLTRAGESIYAVNHQRRVDACQMNAAQVLRDANQIYLNSNRGVDIGGWHPGKIRAGYAELYSNIPHHCALEKGILGGLMAGVGITSSLRHVQCKRQGQGKCLFVVETADREHWKNRTPHEPSISYVPMPALNR